MRSGYSKSLLESSTKQKLLIKKKNHRYHHHQQQQQRNSKHQKKQQHTHHHQHNPIIEFQCIECNIRCHSQTELTSHLTSKSHDRCVDLYHRGELSGAHQVYSYLASHLNHLQSMPRYIPPFPRSQHQLNPTPSSAVSTLCNHLNTIPSSSFALDHIHSSSSEWSRFLSCVSSGAMNLIGEKHNERTMNQQKLILQHQSNSATEYYNHDAAAADDDDDNHLTDIVDDEFDDDEDGIEFELQDDIDESDDLYT